MTDPGRLRFFYLSRCPMCFPFRRGWGLRNAQAERWLSLGSFRPAGHDPPRGLADRRV